MPDSFLTSLFGRHISDDLVRIAPGSYPAEKDFHLIELNTVDLVVSLPDPAIPCEATLLEPETAGTPFLAALRQVPDNQELCDACAHAETST